MSRVQMLEPMSYEYELFGARTCQTCGRTLPKNADFFNHDKSRRDGLTLQCRECRNRRSNRYYAVKRGSAA